MSSAELFPKTCGPESLRWESVDVGEAEKGVDYRKRLLVQKTIAVFNLWAHNEVESRAFVPNAYCLA